MQTPFWSPGTEGESAGEAGERHSAVMLKGGGPVRGQGTREGGRDPHRRDGRHFVAFHGDSIQQPGGALPSAPRAAPAGLVPAHPGSRDAIRTSLQRQRTRPVFHSGGPQNASLPPADTAQGAGLDLMISEAFTRNRSVAWVGRDLEDHQAPAPSASDHSESTTAGSDSRRCPASHRGPRRVTAGPSRSAGSPWFRSAHSHLHNPHFSPHCDGPSAASPRALLAAHTAQT